VFLSRFLPTDFRIRAKRMLSSRPPFPVLGSHVAGGRPDAPVTLAMVCGYGYDVHKPNAGSTFRVGLSRGFAEIGAAYRFLGVHEIRSVVPTLKRPIVAISAYDYLYMDRGTVQFLKKYPTVVWIDPDFAVLRDFWASLGIDYRIRLTPDIVKKVLESEPAFVWANTTQSHLDKFSDWLKRGLRVVPLPLALDTARYYPEPESKKYNEVRMAFVGGYWPKKAIQFETYLRPYERDLVIYGYSPWPYSGYRGMLPEDDERILYQNARVSPAISESDVAVTGDVVERVYKVLGSGGLAVTDVAPVYADLFTRDEALTPNSVDEYHDMVQLALKDDTFNAKYRKSGRAAVLNRHTYAHRARTILEELELNAFLHLEKP
jgi:hypothetical protein